MGVSPGRRGRLTKVETAGPEDKITGRHSLGPGLALRLGHHRPHELIGERAVAPAIPPKEISSLRSGLRSGGGWQERE